ncbi:MAG: hypothetical protein MUO77_10925 [Anaerolineales bacterium]|nr:hypothetical protein [Anaerolineales bacterium]
MEKTASFSTFELILLNGDDLPLEFGGSINPFTGSDRETTPTDQTAWTVPWLDKGKSCFERIAALSLSKR